MAKTTVSDLAGTLGRLQEQLAELSQRIAALEQVKIGHNGALGAAVAVPAPPVPVTAAAESVPAGITEEEMLAIAAAIGAFLGVRAHIRQIRLLSTNAWAQQGRVSIQASHRLG